MRRQSQEINDWQASRCCGGNRSPETLADERSAIRADHHRLLLRQQVLQLQRFFAQNFARFTFRAYPGHFQRTAISRSNTCSSLNKVLIAAQPLIRLATAAKNFREIPAPNSTALPSDSGLASPDQGGKGL
jgi:hypothetical protein